MADYKAAVASAWSREQTFAYLADFRNVADWDPSIERVELRSGTAGLVDAVYDVTFRLAGRTTTIGYTAMLVESPELLVMRGETNAVASTDTITVIEDVNGVQVVYHAELELKGMRKFAEPFAEFVLTRASNRARDSLAAALAEPPTSEAA